MQQLRKLILVEGIPGSGKTTIAEWINAQLEEEGVQTALYLEGHPDHPADYESTAYFTAPAFEDLLTRYPLECNYLKSLVERRDGACFVPFIRAARAGEISGQLLQELIKHDIYELDSVKLHRRLIADRWRRFSKRAADADTTTIFECCFLQNPLVVLLGKHNLQEDAVGQVHDLADIIRPLNPVVVYLSPADVRVTLERARSERPQGWVDRVGAYFSEQAWGKARDVHGYEGMIRFHEMRQTLDLEILASLDFETAILKAPEKDWDAARTTLRRLLLGIGERSER
ncbi:MAG: hypothetical protein JXA97_00935 [Anaerolineales bacterium]|nr:hypothetical protein [Anaerolineales bacterium]